VGGEQRRAGLGGGADLDQSKARADLCGVGKAVEMQAHCRGGRNVLRESAGEGGQEGEACVVFAAGGGACHTIPWYDCLSYHTMV
jgi:hypothetical protein